MSRFRFFLILLQINIGIAIWTSGVSKLFQDYNVTMLYVTATIAFSMFSIIAFFVAEKIASMKRLFTFNGLVSASFLFKLIKAVAFLFVFEKTFAPSGNSHLLHYILTYIVFTVFEVYFLIKISDAASSRL